MPFPTRFWSFAAAIALALLSSCKPPPESVRVKEIVAGPPDLVPHAPANPANHAYQLRAFHLNHVWTANTAHPGSEKSYRAKLTVWDYADDESSVAELYFEDAGPGTAPTNADPNRAKRPYQIRFPMSALGPILSTLRSTNEPVFLYYYEGGWAVGTYTAEPVGID